MTHQEILNDAIRHFHNREYAAKKAEHVAPLPSTYTISADRFEANIWRQAADYLEKAWCAIRQPVSTASACYDGPTTPATPVMGGACSPPPATLTQGFCSRCRMVKILSRTDKDLLTSAEQVLRAEVRRLKAENEQLRADLEDHKAAPHRMRLLQDVYSHMENLPAVTILFGGQQALPKCLNRDKVLGILAGAIQETRPYAGS